MGNFWVGVFLALVSILEAMRVAFSTSLGVSATGTFIAVGCAWASGWVLARAEFPTLTEETDQPSV